MSRWASMGFWSFLPHTFAARWTLLMAVSCVLLIPRTIFADCLKPSAGLAWKWGLGGGAAWLQYTDTESQRPYFSILRSPLRESTQIILHDVSAAISKSHEIPGFIPFSFESGFQRKGKNDQVTAADGVAMLVRFENGRVGARSGNLTYEDAGTALLYRVSVDIKRSFRFYAADTCYEIPVNDEALKVMQVLFLPQHRFKQEASKLFLK